MSVFKYVTPDGALRYLRTRALRITPPDQFNDPFEMRPNLDLSGVDFMDQAPALVRDELAKTVVQALVAQGWAKTADEATAGSNALVSFLMRDLSKAEEQRFLAAARTNAPPGAADNLLTIRANFDEMYKRAICTAQSLVPEFSRSIETMMHRVLPRHVGVLCLSHSSKHPLMWAHYTDCHKGALLEFDEEAPCFNRRRHGQDDFGRLHRVWYADTRPTLAAHRDSDAFVALALTKALEWAYEQELRLLWPLELADRTVDVGSAKVHLIDVPATALRSVTIGCKANEEFVKELLQVVGDVGSRVTVRASVMDDRSFSLNYRDLN